MRALRLPWPARRGRTHRARAPAVRARVPTASAGEHPPAAGADARSLGPRHEPQTQEERCATNRGTIRADGTIEPIDFHCRLADELRRPGIRDGILVVLPGDEPGAYRVFLCEDADDAAACLHRHGCGKEDRTR